MKPTDAVRALRTRAQLAAMGVTARALDRALADGSIVRVSTGRYATGDVWRGEFAEGQHLLRVAGVFANLQSDAVASFASAAVLHGIPLWKLQPRRVHLAGMHLNGQTSNAPGVARHRLSIPADDVTEIAGIRCTSLARTTADIVRCLDAARGLAAADAAMRAVAYDPAPRTYDVDLAETFRAEVAMHLPVGARGVKQARCTLALTDGRSESPGESVSRMLLIQIGFAVPRIQVEIPAPRRGDYRVDFGLDDADAWGEYDGDSKYIDPSILSPDADLTDILLAEKQREDWIRGTTNRKYARWGTEHLTQSALRERLAAFHIFPPR